MHACTKVMFLSRGRHVASNIQSTAEVIDKAAENTDV